MRTTHAVKYEDVRVDISSKYETGDNWYLRHGIYTEVSNGSIPARYLAATKSRSKEEYEFYIEGTTYDMEVVRLVRKNLAVDKISIKKRGSYGKELNRILLEILHKKVMEKSKIKKESVDTEHINYLKNKPTEMIHTLTPDNVKSRAKGSGREQQLALSVSAGGAWVLNSRSAEHLELKKDDTLNFHFDDEEGDKKLYIQKSAIGSWKVVERQASGNTNKPDAPKVLTFSSNHLKKKIFEMLEYEGKKFSFKFKPEKVTIKGIKGEVIELDFSAMKSS